MTFVCIAGYCAILVFYKHFEMYWGTLTFMLKNLIIGDIEGFEPIIVGLISG